MTLEELRAGFIALTKSPTPEYKAVMQCWEGFKHTIRIKGKWRLQGFMTWLMHNHELLRCVDSSLPPFPALHLFTPKVIAHLLSIPPEEVGCRSGKIGRPGRPSRVLVPGGLFKGATAYRWKAGFSDSWLIDGEC